MIGEKCIVRTYSAGVHVGIVASIDGTAVTLRDAVRVWRWRGANTLHELAARGPAEEWTRISDRVPSILLTQSIEVIPIEPAAIGRFEPRWP